MTVIERQMYDTRWRTAQIRRCAQVVDGLGLVYYMISIEQLEDGLWQASGHAYARAHAWPVGYMAMQYRTLTDATLDIESTWIAKLTKQIQQSAAEAHELNDTLKLARERNHKRVFGQLTFFDAFS